MAKRMRRLSANLNLILAQHLSGKLINIFQLHLKISCVYHYDIKDTIFLSDVFKKPQ